MKTLIAQGAEAKIYKKGSKIIKDRIKKNYRLEVIDLRLRKTRTKAEAKLICEANRVGIPVPKVIDEDLKKTRLVLEDINGEKFRDYLENEQNKSKVKKWCNIAGEQTRKLHEAGIVHSDLTTSNMILSDKLYIIDFGLGQFSNRLEDKAVDIHLFKECLRSKHHKIWRTCWEAFKSGYKNEDVLKQMRKVEARGRYKKS